MLVSIAKLLFQAARVIKLNRRLLQGGLTFRPVLLLGNEAWCARPAAVLHE